MLEKAGPLILAVETATPAGSVSLARGNDVLAVRSGNTESSHSSDLIENIERVLRSAEAEIFDVDLFAIAVGPGSFTGLRIGLATVKAFAVCAARKCAGVSTLAAIAHAGGTSQRTVAVLPAGRGEVFAQMFSVLDGRVQALDSAAHIKPNELLEKYRELQAIRWAGDGTHQQRENLRQQACANSIVFVEGESKSAQADWVLAPRQEQLATSVAALGLGIYQNGNSISAGELRADYVRPSDAEINERWQSLESKPALI